MSARVRMHACLPTCVLTRVPGRAGTCVCSREEKNKKEDTVDCSPLSLGGASSGHSRGIHLPGEIRRDISPIVPIPRVPMVRLPLCSARAHKYLYVCGSDSLASTLGEYSLMLRSNSIRSQCETSRVGGRAEGARRARNYSIRDINESLVARR